MIISPGARANVRKQHGCHAQIVSHIYLDTTTVRCDGDNLLSAVSSFRPLLACHIELGL